MALELLTAKKINPSAMKAFIAQTQQLSDQYDSLVNLENARQSSTDQTKYVFKLAKELHKLNAQLTKQG